MKHGGAHPFRLTHFCVAAACAARASPKLKLLQDDRAAKAATAEATAVGATAAGQGEAASAATAGATHDTITAEQPMQDRFELQLLQDHAASHRGPELRLLQDCEHEFFQPSPLGLAWTL